MPNLTGQYTTAAAAWVGIGREQGNIQNNGTTAITTFGVTAPTVDLAYYSGRDCIHIHGGTAGGNVGAVAGAKDQMVFHIQYTSTGLAAGVDALDDFAVCRCVGFVAYPAGVPTNAGFDNGFQVIWNTSIASVLFDPPNAINQNAGFGFFLTDVNTLHFKGRKNWNSAATFDQALTLPAGFNYLQWNAYEIRITGATSARDASVSAFLNGIQVFSSTWTTLGLPTLDQVAGAASGLIPVVSVAGANELYVAQIRGSASPVSWGLL